MTGASTLPSPSMATTIDAEGFEEILLCARYGDLEDLKQYFTQLPIDTVEAVLQRQDDRGNTALHFCAANGHLPVVEYLLTLQKGAIDSTNEGGNTPLHWACLNGHLETVKSLVAAGADVKLKNRGRRMPIDEAESQGKESIVLWMLALDMKREKEAGVYNGEDKDVEESGEGDVNVNMTAGEVEAEVAAASNATESSKEAFEKSSEPFEGTEAADEMDMLD